MPNWCVNTLTVTGEPEEISKFATGMSNPEGLDFNDYLEYPEVYAAQDAQSEGEGFNSGGYEWCVANWGTKWNACSVGVDMGEQEIEFYFETAWSPPQHVVAKMAETYPALTFVLKYEEGGCDFSGIDKYVGGVLVNTQSGDYDEFPVTEHEDWDEEDWEDEV